MATTSMRQIFQLHAYTQETHEIIKDKLSTCTLRVHVVTLYVYMYTYMYKTAHVHVQFNLIMYMLVYAPQS